MKVQGPSAQLASEVVEFRWFHRCSPDPGTPANAVSFVGFILGRASGRHPYKYGFLPSPVTADAALSPSNRRNAPETLGFIHRALPCQATNMLPVPWVTALGTPVRVQDRGNDRESRLAPVTPTEGTRS